MANVEVIREKPVQPKVEKIVVELTPAEAILVQTLIATASGNQLVNRLFEAFRDAGVPYCPQTGFVTNVNKYLDTINKMAEKL